MRAFCFFIVRSHKFVWKYVNSSFVVGDILIPKCIFQVAPYERPALSKGFLLPEGIDSSHGTLSAGYFYF